MAVTVTAASTVTALPVHVVNAAVAAAVTGPGMTATAFPVHAVAAAVAETVTGDSTVTAGALHADAAADTVAVCGTDDETAVSSAGVGVRRCWKPMTD